MEDCQVMEESGGLTAPEKENVVNGVGEAKTKESEYIPIAQEPIDFSKLSLHIPGETLLEQIETMLDSEARSKRVFLRNADYYEYRRTLVDWMFEFAENWGLHGVTTHLAVYLLDTLLSKFIRVTPDRLKLVAICCISIAAKYEERDDRVPTVGHYNEFAEQRYSHEDLGWEVSMLTAKHFEEYFLVACAIPGQECVEGRILSNVSRLRHYIAKYSSFFLDMCIQEPDFLVYRSSALGAAAVAAARRALQCEGPISRPLCQLSGYSPEEISPIVERIWSVFEREYPASAKGITAKAQNSSYMEASPGDVKADPNAQVDRATRMQDCQEMLAST